MSADVLREAAALMRERATTARSGRWFAVGEAVRADWALVREVATCHGSIPEGNHANAEHIASWHPAVAFAVADWLDHTAEACGLNRSPHVEESHRLAHTVARTYLGGA